MSNRPSLATTSISASPGNDYDISPIGEPTIYPLSRGIIANTSIDETNNMLVTSTNTGDLFSEPSSIATISNPPLYPYNQTWDSEVGHSVQLDDTPGGERVRIQHGVSKNFIEMHPDGTQVVKVFGKGFDITIDDKNVYVGGICNISIVGNCNMKVSGDVNADIGGKADVTVAGDVTMEVAGKYTASIEGTCDITSGGNMTFVAPNIHLNP